MWSFIDSKKTSLKVVLLESGNNLPSLPLDLARDLKEIYETNAKTCHFDQIWEICVEKSVVKSYKVLLFHVSVGQRRYKAALHSMMWPTGELYEADVKNVQHGAISWSKEYTSSTFTHQARSHKKLC